MRKTRNTLLLCLLLGLSACHFESFDDRCARETREYTEKQCPRRMDQYTVMDSLTYDKSSHTLNYYYTVEGQLDNDEVMNDQNRAEIRNLLHKNILNSVELKSYKEKGFNFFYCYYSKSSGKIRFQARFTPEDYKGKKSVANPT